ncbi:Cytochrome P450 4C1 [Blattella germanica]|nr:Cytochrome P450 4C1 [Blattella germanica]
MRNWQSLLTSFDVFTKFQGHDTTTAAIGWALQLLASHPEIQQKAYEEVKSFFIQDSDHNLTMQDMKYLEMVIKETLRLYPSVPLTGREIKEDVVIDGYTIPAGMKVAVIPYHTHRVEEHFPHPEIFDPDRFLPENVSKRHPYAYIPFSAGPRNCIGQKFAMLEMKSTLSHILYNYKLQATGKVPPALPELILRPAVGVYLKITKRVH